MVTIVFSVFGQTDEANELFNIAAAEAGSAGDLVREVERFSTDAAIEEQLSQLGLAGRNDVLGATSRNGSTVSFEILKGSDNLLSMATQAWLAAEAL